MKFVAKHQPFWLYAPSTTIVILKILTNFIHKIFRGTQTNYSFVLFCGRNVARMRETFEILHTIYSYLCEKIRKNGVTLVYIDDEFAILLRSRVSKIFRKILQLQQILQDCI